MKIKECIVCGNEFDFKNKSKKTCSDKCRQQLSRDKKKEQETIIQNQDGLISDNYYKSEFDSAMTELYLASIERILSFCKGEPIKYSELNFLDRIADVLEFYSQREEQYSVFHDLLQKMTSINRDEKEENDSIVFKTKKVKSIIKELKKVLREDF